MRRIRGGQRLTEDSIRPDKLMNENDRLHAKDLRRLLKKKGAFVEVNCPACNSGKKTPKWKKDGFSYSECVKCGTVYVNPRPTPEILADYYRTAENYAFWSKTVFPKTEKTRLARIVKPRVKRLLDICRKHGVRDGTLVEVGAGAGTFLEEASRSGYFKKHIAIEPTPGFAQLCRNRGLEVIELPVESVKTDKMSTDAVACFETIEHLYDPAAFLKASAAMLKPGGLLILTCPNLKGFDVTELGTVSQVVDLEHLNYFHPGSMRLLMDRCGMDVLEILTPGRLDAEIVRKRALAGLHDLDSEPFLKQILIDEWDSLGEAFQDFLAENMLSSHMWVVARKP